MSTLNTATGSTASKTLTVATLNACLSDIQAFQQRYSDEQAKAAANQKKMQDYNNAHAAWVIAKSAQDNQLEAGRTAPPGYVWYGGSLQDCSKV